MQVVNRDASKGQILQVHHHRWPSKAPQFGRYAQILSHLVQSAKPYQNLLIAFVPITGHDISSFWMPEIEKQNIIMYRTKVMNMVPFLGCKFKFCSAIETETISSLIYLVSMAFEKKGFWKFWKKNNQYWKYAISNCSNDFLHGNYLSK